jgi:hypothetical protein
MRQLTQVEDSPKLTSHVYAQSHRLLFRGSLSIPDSRLLLDGLSFTIPIDNTRSPGINLLKNPLALALESMRGRTLALSGISRVDSVQLDRTAEVDVSVDLSYWCWRKISDMLTEMFIHQRLSAVSTLRTSSAQLRLILLMATRIMVSASRLVTLVRTCCFLRLFPCKRSVLQTAKMRRTSLYLANFSKQITLTRPPPHPRIPFPYFSSVPHVSSPWLLCNNHDCPGLMTLSHGFRLHSCAPRNVAPRNRPQLDSNDGKRRQYFKTHATS